MPRKKKVDPVQAVVDQIAADLKTNATVIGARESYNDLQSLVTNLNKLCLGYEIDVPVDFNADMTLGPVPGFRPGEVRRRRGSSR